MLMALVLAAAVPAPTDGDGAVVALVKDGDRHCVPDRSLCLEIPVTEDGAGAAELRVTSPASDAPTSIALPGFDDAGAQELWPNLIAAKGGDGAPRFLVDILGRQNAMYSGGGGSAARLHLFELGSAPGSTGLGEEVLNIVWDGSLMIRACFSEQDMKDRLEACHDEYDFAATLTAAPADGGWWPALTYRAAATTFPRTSRRSEDNSAVRLKRADLVRAPDPRCSYDRVLHYNPATSRYEMDRPAPDCSDYTTP